ncbi:MAG: ASCH domain-containing protein [Thaumarchaeota archaeon]|nr:ASCH domain-containing protein [Nitrososphaerota archaeon]
MLAFSSKWKEAILGGTKDVTLRKWPTARVKVGTVYDVAVMGYPPTKFAKVLVTGLRRIKLGEIDDSIAKRDGAASASEVKGYWKKQGFGPDKEMWLVEFKLQG